MAKSKKSPSGIKNKSTKIAHRDDDFLSSARISAYSFVRPSIKVNGEEVDLSARLLSLKVEESISGPARCEIVLNNWQSGANPGYLYLDRAVLNFGMTIEVVMEDISIFNGHIRSLEAIFPEIDSSSLRIYAEDKLQELGMTQGTRSFSNTTLESVFGVIANEHELFPDIDVDGVLLPVVTQNNESDLAFLTRLSEQYDLSVRVLSSALQVRQRQRNGNSLELVLGRNLRSFRVGADVGGQRTKVTVSGWDTNSKVRICEESADHVVQAELGWGTSGAHLLHHSFGDKKETILLEQTTRQQARALSEAAFRRRARHFVRGLGVSYGNPNLRAGGWVEISNLGGGLFNGKHTLQRVCHSYDLTGYVTEIETCRAGVDLA
jgi:phage protein D